MPGWKPGALPLGDSRILVPHKHLVFNELFLCVATAMLMHMLYLTTIVVINFGTAPQPRSEISQIKSLVFCPLELTQYLVLPLGNALSIPGL